MITCTTSCACTSEIAEDFDTSATIKKPASIGRIQKNLLDRVSQLHYPFSLPEHLKADNTIGVNQIVTIFLIESSIHILDQNRYPVDTSLIHLESRKSPTAELFDDDSGRISIHHCEY
ncbi:hypothetical protein Tco_0919530 [Tanacetum coccineum]